MLVQVVEETQTCAQPVVQCLRRQLLDKYTRQTLNAFALPYSGKCLDGTFLELQSPMFIGQIDRPKHGMINYFFTTTFSVTFK